MRLGDLERVRWVEEELLSYHRISKRAYRLELDAPPPTLTPNQNIGAANDLFRRAVAFVKDWATSLDDNYRRAELLLQQIIALYPQSDKLSQTAYHLGEISSRAFKQYRRTATYYGAASSGTRKPAATPASKQPASTTRPSPTDPRRCSSIAKKSTTPPTPSASKKPVAGCTRLGSTPP